VIHLANIEYEKLLEKIENNTESIVHEGCVKLNSIAATFSHQLFADTESFNFFQICKLSRKPLNIQEPASWDVFDIQAELLSTKTWLSTGALSALIVGFNPGYIHAFDIFSVIRKHPLISSLLLIGAITISGTIFIDVHGMACRRIQSY